MVSCWPEQTSYVQDTSQDVCTNSYGLTFLTQADVTKRVVQRDWKIPIPVATTQKLMSHSWEDDEKEQLSFCLDISNLQKYYGSPSDWSMSTPSRKRIKLNQAAEMGPKGLSPSVRHFLKAKTPGREKTKVLDQQPGSPPGVINYLYWIGVFNCLFLFSSNSDCLLEHWGKTIDVSVLCFTCVHSVNAYCEW